MEFRVEILEEQSYKIIQVYGDLNMFNAQIFKTHGEILFSEGCHIAIDLTNTNYIDSSGMGAILNLLKPLKNKGKNLPLINPNDRVLEVFKLVKIDRIFTIVDAIEELPKVDDDPSDDLDLELDTQVE